MYEVTIAALVCMRTVAEIPAIIQQLLHVQNPDQSALEQILTC